jgi:hypothetical protein
MGSRDRHPGRLWCELCQRLRKFASVGSGMQGTYDKLRCEVCGNIMYLPNRDEIRRYVRKVFHPTDTSPR